MEVPSGNQLAHPAMSFAVLSGDTKTGSLKLGNRSASRSALLGFYVELQRIAQERRHRDDQVALATRPDLERGGLPKAQEREAQPQEVCHVVADPA